MFNWCYVTLNCDQVPCLRDKQASSRLLIPSFLSQALTADSLIRPVSSLPFHSLSFSFLSFTTFHCSIQLSYRSYTFIPFTEPTPLVLTHLCIRPDLSHCATWLRHRPTSPRTYQVFPQKNFTSSLHRKWSIMECMERAECW